MSNAITMTVGADIAPLKKDYKDVEQLSKATSKRVADDQKKAARDTATAEKESARASAQAHKEAAKAQADAKKEFGGKIEKLAGAVPGGETLGLAGDLIGAAGAGAAVLAVVGGIAKGLADSHDSVVEMRQGFRDTAREVSFTTSAAATDKAAELAEKARQIEKTKKDAQEKMLFGEGLTEGTVSDTRLGAAWEHVYDKVTATVGAQSKYAEQQAALNKEHEKQNELIEKGAAALRDEAGVENTRVTVGERAGALAAAELAALKEKEALTDRMGSAGMSKAQIDNATVPIDERLKEQKFAINRKADEAMRDTADQLESAKARAAAAVAGQLSPTKGEAMEIQRIRVEAAKKRKYANVSGTPEERRNQLLAEAGQLDIQGDQAEAMLRLQNGNLTPAEIRARDQREKANARRVASNMRAQAANAKEHQKTLEKNGQFHGAPVPAMHPAPPVKGIDGKDIGKDIGAAVLLALKGATFVITNT